jgi:HTH-type transcriptional regulator/antitoxin HigA
MDPALKTALDAWPKVAPILSEPRSEAEYDRLVTVMEELLELIRAGRDVSSTSHPAEVAHLETLFARVSDLVEAYDDEHYPMPEGDGTELLKAIMAEHGLRQSDLPEIGAQSVVSEILSGKRRINVNQARALHERWPMFPVAVWLEIAP